MRMESLAPSTEYVAVVPLFESPSDVALEALFVEPASREQTYDQSDDPSRRTKFACVHLALALRSYCAKNRSAHPENISEGAEIMFCHVRLIIVRFYRTAILPSHFRHYFRLPLIPPFPLSSTDVADAAYTWCGYLLRHNRNYAITGIATERWAHGQLQSQAGSQRISPTTSITDGSVPPN